MRGAALLLVLWLIALLTALIGAFALTARVELLQGRVLGKGAEAQEIARAGVEYALVRLADTDPATHWLPDGRRYRWNYAGSRVEISIVDETGKVDLNQADAPLLSALIKTVGGDPRPGRPAGRGDHRLARSRPPDPGRRRRRGSGLCRRRTSVRREGRAVRNRGRSGAGAGHDPATVCPAGARPDPVQRPPAARPRLAPAPVLAALGLDPAGYLARRRSTQARQRRLPTLGQSAAARIVSSSHVTLKEGRQATLRTVVRAGGGPVPGSVYTTLRWEEAAAPR